jgi:cardiolipin synthase
MVSRPASNSYQWLSTGDEVFPAMLDAIASARETVRFEFYIYAADNLGRRFRDALVSAQQRGVRVQVLIDSLGSLTLSGSFWQPLVAAGGEARWFNPLLLRRFGYRDHRKMLVCDESIAFVGGFNINEVYNGDGVKSGWCDLGLKCAGPVANELAAAFDEMFERADFKHKRLSRLRGPAVARNVEQEDCQLLLTGPGRGPNPFSRALGKDLATARDVKIIAAYFLPTWRIRRALGRVVRRGGRVQLVLPGKSDVRLSHLAGRSLYRRILKAGIEIYEYQPQILHAKLLLIDGVVYAGSSNLDPRSLRINYELMLRITNEPVVAEAAEIFARRLALSQKIEPDVWRRSGTWWRRFKQRWAYFLLMRIDPLIVRWSRSRTPN